MILLLAGTAEARLLAEMIAAAGLKGVATLAGAVRVPAPLALPVFSGGFGGAQGFRQFVRAHKISAVLDATHPFAAKITERTALICANDGLPYLRLERPVWEAGPGDNWHQADDEAAASARLPKKAVILFAAGRASLARFSFPAGAQVHCRVIDPPTEPPPLGNVTYLYARPPFSVEDEIALLRRLKVNVIVVKNAGGTPSESKLIAARKLGIGVIMLARPGPPATPFVSTVSQAVAWAVAQEKVCI